MEYFSGRFTLASKFLIIVFSQMTNITKFHIHCFLLINDKKHVFFECAIYFPHYLMLIQFLFYNKKLRNSHIKKKFHLKKILTKKVPLHLAQYIIPQNRQVTPQRFWRKCCKILKKCSTSPGHSALKFTFVLKWSTR